MQNLGVAVQHLQDGYVSLQELVEGVVTWQSAIKGLIDRHEGWVSQLEKMDQGIQNLSGSMSEVYPTVYYHQGKLSGIQETLQGLTVAQADLTRRVDDLLGRTAQGEGERITLNAQMVSVTNECAHMRESMTV